MKPILITYDRKGNVLSVRFSEKQEIFCRKSEAGNKGVVYSIATDGSIIGFEILNFLAKGERRPSKILPVQTRILAAT
jgi:uncharacterized protein YuzE